MTTAITKRGQYLIHLCEILHLSGIYNIVCHYYAGWLNNGLDYYNSAQACITRRIQVFLFEIIERNYPISCYCLQSATNVSGSNVCSGETILYMMHTAQVWETFLRKTGSVELLRWACCRVISWLRAEGLPITVQVVALPCKDERAVVSGRGIVQNFRSRVSIVRPRDHDDGDDTVHRRPPKYIFRARRYSARAYHRCRHASLTTNTVWLMYIYNLVVPSRPHGQE